MTIQSYPVQIFPSGEVTPIAGWIGGKAKARIVVEMSEDDWQTDPTKILPNGKTALEDFFDFCKELNLPLGRIGNERFD